jgi:hypothetical protein
MNLARGKLRAQANDKVYFTRDVMLGPVPSI